MAERPYKLTRSAAEDLQGIWQYSRKRWSEEHADSYLEKLKTACETLSSMPAIGQTVPRLGTGIRVYDAEHHLIFYIDRADMVQIFAVLHERMDVISRLVARLHRKSPH